MRARDLKGIIRRVPDMPDESILPDPVAAVLLGVSVKSLNRNNPVPPIELGPRMRGRNLGHIRALARE
jgi:hypothetical protein